MPQSKSENPFKNVPIEVQMEYAEKVRTSDASNRVAIELQNQGFPVAETLRAIVRKVFGIEYDEVTENMLANIENEANYQSLSDAEKILFAFMRLSHDRMIFRLEEKQENTKEE